VIASDLSECAGFGPAALTIGIFDGVHAGHRELFRRTLSIARERGLHPVALTFDPHPASVVAPDHVPRMLMSLDERCQAILAEGIEHILVLHFDTAVSRIGPEEFATRYLRDGLRARAVLVGEKFRFGYGQSGDTAALQRLGAQFGFETHILERVRRRGMIVSSTEIRRRIDAGNVALAARLLERCYALSGEVVRGHGIGAKQTVPTLNLQTGAEVLPRSGVYITRTTDADPNVNARRWNSITNVGYRPTFGPTSAGGALSIETFLLDPLEGASPSRIRVEFLRRVREERKFESPAALKDQILRDVAKAQAFFRRCRRWVRS
jgi:riboflavin kinase / FMN adenylyltransferase